MINNFAASSPSNKGYDLYWQQKKQPERYEQYKDYNQQKNIRNIDNRSNNKRSCIPLLNGAL